MYYECDIIIRNIIFAVIPTVLYCSLHNIIDGLANKVRNVSPLAKRVLYMYVTEKATYSKHIFKMIIFENQTLTGVP